MSSIRTRGLPDGSHMETIYTFDLDERGPQVILHIPGNHAGPDNCYVTHPEQETWLNSLKHLRIQQTWDCQWTFEDRGAVEEFLKMLAPFLEVTQSDSVH